MVIPRRCPILLLALGATSALGASLSGSATSARDGVAHSLNENNHRGPLSGPPLLLKRSPGDGACRECLCSPFKQTRVVLPKKSEVTTIHPRPHLERRQEGSVLRGIIESATHHTVAHISPQAIGVSHLKSGRCGDVCSFLQAYLATHEGLDEFCEEGHHDDKDD